MSDDNKVKLVQAVLFAIRLRHALENIQSTATDENVKEYVDYLLKDDRHVERE